METSTIRRHITNICKTFGLSNNQGEHYSYREDLISLFTKYQPEKVNYKLKNTTNKRIKAKFPDSPLKSGSFFYISRPPIEQRCTQEVLKSGALIRIRGSQGMGKTSLVNLILDHAQNHNHRVISLNLRHCFWCC